MNKVLLSMLAFAGMSVADTQAVERFHAQQRQQPRTSGSARRSAYMLPLALGKLERGTRAVSRGPYPRHLIDNCNAMRVRNGAP